MRLRIDTFDQKFYSFSNEKLQFLFSSNRQNWLNFWLFFRITWNWNGEIISKSFIIHLFETQNKTFSNIVLKKTNSKNNADRLNFDFSYLRQI